MTTYRVGNHQPQNIYRDDAYVGVMFTAEDAALIVEALNGTAPALCLTWIGGMARMCELPHGHDGDHKPADSCTCPPPSGPRTMPDPLCVVHRGRRIRGPKPPPCTAERHGAGNICKDPGVSCRSQP